MSSSVDVVDAFIRAYGQGVTQSPEPSVRTGSENTIEEFSLKSLVVAVASFINSMFTRLVNIEVSNLCADDVSINGNKKQLNDVLCSTIGSVQKKLQNQKALISVIIHDLKRPSDCSLLPKESEDGIPLTSQESCGKYVAISVKPKVNSSIESKSRVDPNNFDSSNISYYDGGVIIRSKSSHAIIYLARSPS